MTHEYLVRIGTSFSKLTAFKEVTNEFSLTILDNAAFIYATIDEDVET